MNLQPRPRHGVGTATRPATATVATRPRCRRPARRRRRPMSRPRCFRSSDPPGVDLADDAVEDGRASAAFDDPEQQHPGLSLAEVGVPAVDPRGAHRFHRVSAERPHGAGRRGPRQTLLGRDPDVRRDGGRPRRRPDAMPCLPGADRLSTGERERNILVLCPAERRDRGRRGTRTVVHPFGREGDATRGKQVGDQNIGRCHWLGRIDADGNIMNGILCISRRSSVHCAEMTWEPTHDHKS